MQTFTGRAFWPMDPLAHEIDILDVAHSLSMQCRYAGHSTIFYSVAEHSVYVSRNVPPSDRLWALLHDAPEAYLVDVPRPVKPFLPGYRDAEDRVMAAVCERFGMPPDMPVSVKEADNAILADERDQVMAPCDREWNLTRKGVGVKIEGWSPVKAKAMFLNEFQMITETSS